MIPFKQVIQASILSTSWMTLMSPSRANFVHDPEAKEKLNQIFESFIKSGESFQLHLSSCGKSYAIATKGAQGELFLDFSKNDRSVLCPFSMVLEQSSFNSTIFSSVKILYLKSVSSLVGSMVSDLFSSFRSLVRLKIEKCDGLETLDIKASKSLKNFEVADCANIARVVISARELYSFSYCGVFSSFQLVDVPNLVEFTLDMRNNGANEEFDCEDALSLLCSVKDVQVLTISSRLIETLCCAGVIFNKLDFQFSKLEALRCLSSKISTKTRDSIACFLHMTPSLEELIVEIDQTSRPGEYPFISEYWHEPHLWKDYATVKHEACILKDLKTIKINGFTRENDELLLIDLFFHVAINLKEMIVAYL